MGRQVGPRDMDARGDGAAYSLQPGVALHLQPYHKVASAPAYTVTFTKVDIADHLWCTDFDKVRGADQLHDVICHTTLPASSAFPYLTCVWLQWYLSLLLVSLTSNQLTDILYSVERLASGVLSFVLPPLADGSGAGATGRKVAQLCVWPPMLA